MRIDSLTGLLEGVRYVASPHCDDRPADTTVDLLVIHGISLPPNHFGGPFIEALFMGTLDPQAHPYFLQIAGIRVSAHALIRRDGSVIQFVPFTQRAWHAGQSTFCGRSRCNDFSIGIELEGADHIPYTQEQYASLAEVTAAILMAFPNIGWNTIVGHSDIAPERKNDPGSTFDWTRYRKALS